MGQEDKESQWKITSGDPGKPGNSQNVPQLEGAAVATLLLSSIARIEF